MAAVSTGNIEPMEACTRAVYIGPEQMVITGRTMDWKEDIMSNIYVFPRGMKRAGYNKGETVNWTSKYGSVIATGYDIGTCDGINEKGLVASLLFLPESVYSLPGDTRPVMGISIWTQYVLDNTEAGDWYTVRSAYCTSSGETVYSDYDELGIEGGIPVGATSRIYNAVSNGTKGNQIDWISLSSSAEKLEVLRKTQPDGSFKVVKTVTDPDEIRHGSYIDTDTTITESYFYTVRAYLNQSGMAVGGWYEQDGVEIQALPNMPTMLTASYLASDTPCIQIGWDINENTKDSCDGYYIYRRDSQDSDWQLMGTNAGENNNLFMDASIEKGSTYEYVVRAYKEDFNGNAVESASPEVVRAVVPK